MVTRIPYPAYVRLIPRQESNSGSFRPYLGSEIETKSLFSHLSENNFYYFPTCPRTVQQEGKVWSGRHSRAARYLRACSRPRCSPRSTLPSTMSLYLSSSHPLSFCWPSWSSCFPSPASSSLSSGFHIEPRSYFSFHSKQPGDKILIPTEVINSHQWRDLLWWNKPSCPTQEKERLWARGQSSADRMQLRRLKTLVGPALQIAPIFPPFLKTVETQWSWRWWFLSIDRIAATDNIS